MKGDQSWQSTHGSDRRSWRGGTRSKRPSRELARRESQGLATRLDAAAAAPILPLSAAEDVWSRGIGQVMVSRQMDNGNVAFAAFLVDLYCLGVENAMWNVLPRATYDSKVYAKMAEQGEIVRLRPECARKLVEARSSTHSTWGFRRTRIIAWRS